MKCSVKSGISSTALAQGRDVDGDHVQPMEEILAEPAARRELAEVLVGRGDHAHVDPDVVPASQP